MPLIDNSTWRSIHNNMKLNIHEFAYANFQWTGRNTYSCNRCFMVMEGHGNVTNHTDGTRYRLESGKALFMPAFLDLSFEFQQDLRFISCHFNMELLPNVDIFRNQKACTTFPVSPDELKDLLPDITSEPSWLDWCRMEGFLWKQFLKLPFPEKQTIADYLTLADKYNPLLQYIQKNLSAKLDVGRLADICGVSRGTLSRNFSRDFHMTLKTFIQQQLLAQASRYLTVTSLSIQEIARKLDFSSEFYFSNFFHRLTGISPTAFRQGAGLLHKSSIT